MHAGRHARRRGHGSVSLEPVETSLLAATGSTNGFGLGFRNDAGVLTHHMWVNTENAGQGPYHVLWTACSTVGQFVELLGLLRNLGDQVYLVWIAEPAGVQLLDFLVRPFRRHQEARRGEYETTNMATANFQYRLVDVEAGLGAAARRRPLPECTIRVTDPITAYLDGDGWTGVAGDYRVGADGATLLVDGASRPDVVISVGDLTRAWLGVLPLATLRETRSISVSEDLAGRLDESFAGPLPRTDWLY